MILMLGLFPLSPPERRKRKREYGIITSPVWQARRACFTGKFPAGPAGLEAGGGKE